ncbi:sigma 54-interacting transcriptional regulator [Wenzhouxiangella sediminis]|uniref:Response regulator n=1 Tax=Wenzhouxiangella sediminis TaxID=1792836 RepID=A0A3E1K6M0_9GAMM|nr:sigma 54-interacting transcriptional regulator [Wenzhouxiangella sediminis]RFF29676.1 response regulator [Wenzhouxiangella sediminis]
MTERLEADEAERNGCRILLVDDDPGLLRLISLRLESNGYLVDTAESGEAALGRVAAQAPDAVITDLRMEGMDGMALFRQLRERDPALPVVILTAHGTIPDAVAATREGAFGFLTKPFDSAELLETIAEATGRNRAGAGRSASWRESIVTRSHAMETLLSELEMVAESDASVLLIGESGTGKEVIARAIHDASPRRNGPFVAINCASVPAELLESELFGYRKGAFTGADSDRDGLFVTAAGGTLLLDEIGDMPAAFQAKLLRALQEKRVRPVGAAEEVATDVRVVSATHRDLERAIRDGDFREDLFYRLNVVQFDVPALRDRPEDIVPLAEHFLADIQKDRLKADRIQGFSRDALRVLLGHDWPGNVRQLANVVEQACVLCRKGPVPANLVQRALRRDPTGVQPLAEARDAFERDYLVRIMRMAGGNVSEAARLAGRNRTEFYRLLGRHQLEPGDFKD